MKGWNKCKMVVLYEQTHWTDKQLLLSEEKHVLDKN